MKLLCAALVLTCMPWMQACEREQRRFSEPAGNAPALAAPPAGMTLSRAHAAARNSPYEENAYGISQGKLLFTWYNCVGCHAHGGGGIGPALMDDKWIYGHEPAAIYETIVEGRPNGMPSFRGRMPEMQVWQLVSYVRSMSALVPSDAAPGRHDGLQVAEPELRRERARPRSGVGPATQ